MLKRGDDDEPKSHKFTKDDPRSNRNGRPKGKPNRVTTLLKDAIIRAAELTGRDKKGKDGLVGYLQRLAIYEPKSFAALLGRVIPLHVVADVDHNVRELRSREDVLEELRERGLNIAMVYPRTLEFKPPRYKQGIVQDEDAEQGDE
jgi:hypothetical protein